MFVIHHTSTVDRTHGMTHLMGKNDGAHRNQQSTTDCVQGNFKSSTLLLELQ